VPPKRKKTDEELSARVGSSLLSPLDVRRMRCRIGMFLRELADECRVSRQIVSD